MSWTAIAAAGIGAAGSLVGGIGKGHKARKEARRINDTNIEFQREVNQQNIDWNTEMWNKTNQYNSPIMQMQRFKEAGLNPHLIYGQGNETSMPSAPNLKAPHADNVPPDTTVNEIGAAAFNAAQSYLAYRKQQTEIDNMEKTNQVMDAQIQNTNANTAGTLVGTARTQQQIDQANELWSNTVGTAEANLKNIFAQTANLEQQIRSSQTGQRLSESQIRAAAQSIRESQQKIEFMRMQGDNLKLDNELKELDIKLKRLGIQPSDNALFRIPTQILSNPEYRKKSWEGFKNWFSK